MKNTSLRDRILKNRTAAQLLIKNDPSIKTVDFTTDGKALITTKEGQTLDATKYISEIKKNVVSGAVPVNTAIDLSTGTANAVTVQKKGIDIAKDIGEQLLGGDITLANIKKLLNNDPTNTALLPKTKAIKDAENVIKNTPTGSDYLTAGTPLTFSNPIVITILLGLFLLAAYFFKK